MRKFLPLLLLFILSACQVSLPVRTPAAPSQAAYPFPPKQTSPPALTPTSSPRQLTQVAQTELLLRQRFDQYDRNHDGQVSRQELNQPELFDRLDQNRDGFISRREAGVLPVSTVAAGSQPAAAASTQMNTTILAEIDSRMQAAIQDQEAAGLVLLLEMNGSPVLFKAYGWGDREAKIPMTEDAIFRIYSMTKPILVAAALSLYEEGKFNLDDPIYLHLPEWKNVDVELEYSDPNSGKMVSRLVPADTPITVRMLLTHTSGLDYGADGGGDETIAFFDQTSANHTEPSLAEFSQNLARQPLRFQPGTAYQYGHSSDILGRYLEAVTGKPLDTVIAERVLTPLKMNDTAFYVSLEKISRLAAVYEMVSGNLVRGLTNQDFTVKPQLLLGGQGLVATASDYARFGQMLLNGGELDGVRVLKAATVDLMFQNQLLSIYPDGSPAYGFGAGVDGLGSYFWSGAAGTFFWVDRKTGLLGIFMVQGQGYQTGLDVEFRQLAYPSQQN